MKTGYAPAPERELPQAELPCLPPAGIAGAQVAAGVRKAGYSFSKSMLLSVFAGMLIAFAAATASTAAHAIPNAGLARMVMGLLFPFGLILVVVLGAELFTGNCLIVSCVMDGKVRVLSMLKNWLYVYVGNFIGSVVVAAGCAFTGQLDYSAGGLAVATIKTAAHKCDLSFGQALVLGIFCNVLVCLGVMMAFGAKDLTGKAVGAFLPVAFFVICGFEHSVANMFYIPAGLFALTNPVYAQLVAAAGVDVSALTWGNFLLSNLVPVTLGNILGGGAVAALFWTCFLRKKAA